MGVADREYVRAGPRSGSGVGRLSGLSFNTWLIIINIVVFVVDPMLSQFRQPVVVRQQVDAASVRQQLVLTPLTSPLPAIGTTQVQTFIDPRTGQPVGQRTTVVMPPLQAIGRFSTADAFVHLIGSTPIFGLEVWRFITFQFLHGGVLHLALNMLGLWVFGGLVEQQLGRRRYAAFYLACGMAGAMAYLLLNFLGSQLGVRLPGVLTGDPYTTLIGASAGVFGVIMAAAKIAPDDKVLLIFPPVPLRLKYLAYGYVLLALANLLGGGNNAGGDAAHVGGAIAGYFLIRHTHVLRDFLDIFGRGSARRGSSGRDEVDRILEKVSTTGLGSLTETERRILQRDTARRRDPGT